MATYHFVGSDGADLTQASVWASSQGGAGGAGVPGNLDTAIFDQTNPTQITVTLGQSITGLEVTSTAKVKILASGIHDINTIVNEGLLTLSGTPIYYQVGDTEETAFGDHFFVIQDITNQGTLYSDSDLILSGSVLEQSGIFGKTDYVWGEIPETGALDANLFLKDPGGTLAPGNYGFRNVGQLHNLSVGNSLNDDGLVSVLLGGDFSCTLEQDAEYGFFGFGGSGNDTYSAEFNLDGAILNCTSFQVITHGPEVIVNALGTRFRLSSYPEGSTVGSFLIGAWDPEHTIVLNKDASTVVEVVPGFNPDSLLVLLGGTVELPGFVVHDNAELALANPVGFPRHLVSLQVLPGGGVLAADYSGGINPSNEPIVILGSFICQDGYIVFDGINEVQVRGNFEFSGLVGGSGDISHKTPSLVLDVEGDFVVSGTNLEIPDMTPGGPRRKSYWNTGGYPFSQSTVLDVGGRTQVQDLEVYHFLSHAPIVSSSSFGCWNLGLDIVSNCPGRREKQDNQPSGITEHPISEISTTPHQGERWHRSIQAQTGTRIRNSVSRVVQHASDMAWRRSSK